MTNDILAKRIADLERQLSTAKAERDALANAIIDVLYGVVLDDCGNRDENGILRHRTVDDARDGLNKVKAIAQKVAASADEYVATVRQGGAE